VQRNAAYIFGLTLFSRKYSYLYLKRENSRIRHCFANMHPGIMNYQRLLH